jgi:putative membrane protein
VPGWHPHPDVWLILGSVVAGYLIWARRHERETGETTSAHERRLFLAGMAVLLVGSEWPVHDLGERAWYAAHMVQHMAYTLVAAPMLVAGIPAWMWRSAFRHVPLRRAWRTLTRPVVAIIVFNGLLLITHWPAVVELSVTSELAHFTLHSLVVISALIVWWPVFSPLPEMPPISPPGQMLYLFVNSIVPAVPASFLTFGHAPLYRIYETFPRVLGVPALTDQLLAGLIMKIIGGLILWGFIAVIFFRWAERERNGWDALGLRDVDAEMRAELGR